ncbi:MAG: AAA family ATPase, partial [Oscillospiraceae bacterium]|nr:AAA family ATPase [Oscillospiraceae bacterium]
FLSRPRRFGKSLLISTLEAYFTGKKDLFKGLKIDELEKEWTEYPVFRIDFAAGDFNNKETLVDILENNLCKWEKKYNIINERKTLEVRFSNIIEAAEEQTGHKAVILVDEYDKPMLDVIGTEQEQKNRETLKGFYGTFKEADKYIRFVLLTGVTKFSQVSVFSGFNQPDDISMDSQYDSICGITEEELDLYFGESINEMAKTQEYTPDEMRKELKKQYDGYHFSQSMLDIYNPFSIINALKKKSVEAYWYESGTPTYLARLLEGHKVNMQKLTGKLYSREYFIDYRADKEDSLAMLYQSGYLTIKDYDKRRKVYGLDFPNDEVRKGFVSLIGNSY